MPHEIRTFNAERLDAFRQDASAALSALPSVAAATVPSPMTHQVHLTPQSDMLSTSALAAGNEGDVVLRGTIGPFPYEIHLHIKLDGSTVEVTLDVQKPIDLPPYTWKFDLLGVVRDAGGNVVGASDVQPAADMVAAGLDFWCVLKCGGTAILGCLVKCLPSLAGGPAAYVACVTGCAGAGAAGIAVCIATECV
jgi:hypothetical protein